MYKLSGIRHLRATLLAAAVMSCLALAPAARAADPPIPQMATTEPATAVGARSASMEGRIDPRKAPVTWFFQYGPTQNYGRSTAPQQIPAGYNTAYVEWALSGLNPLTFYHYRLVVTASGYEGQSYGADQGFLTGSTGVVFLPASRLKIVHRTVSLPLSCASQRRCIGRFTIATTTQRGTVVCDSSRFSLKPGRRLRSKISISAACNSLILNARGHRLKASVTPFPSTGQIGTVAKVTLTM
jgi:hypothetical protein